MAQFVANVHRHNSYPDDDCTIYLKGRKKQSSDSQAEDLLLSSADNGEQKEQRLVSTKIVIC